MGHVLRRHAEHFAVVAVTGPRQAGKTTLCRQTFPDKSYVTLESLTARRYALEDPVGFMREHRDGAILDEIQHAPALLSEIQVLVDEDRRPGRFVLTGSQNLALAEGMAQSLAGRASTLELMPLSRPEILRFPEPPDDLFDLLRLGGYPELYERGVPADDWHRAYVRTYIERDVRQVLNVSSLERFTTFVALCAGRTGQILNRSGLAGDAGVVSNTARDWLSVLDASYVTWRLPPWTRNLNKRLAKAPKLHFVDTGLAAHLLGITNRGQLLHHPLRGALFETWVASEIARSFRNLGQRPTLYHYRDRRGDEVDLVVEAGDRLTLVETKSGETPRAAWLEPLARLRDALRDAGEWRPITCLVVHGGDVTQPRPAGLLLSWRDLHTIPWSPAHDPAP